VSLAVHMLESANADLALVHDYLQAERGVSYPECFNGGTSPARDRATARAGRNLRLVSVLEAEAARIAALPNATTAPWFPRYQAARQSLAGTRASVIQVIQQLTACENPVGISEAVLPLYVGQTTGASERFFASTRFLTAMATDASTGPLHLAAGARADAQTAYNQQVVSDFQRDLVPTAHPNEVTKGELVVHFLSERLAAALSPNPTVFPPAHNVGVATQAQYRADLGQVAVISQTGAVTPSGGLDGSTNLANGTSEVVHFDSNKDITGVDLP
jgi:hypothetical protein